MPQRLWHTASNGCLPSNPNYATCRVSGCLNFKTSAVAEQSCRTSPVQLHSLKPTGPKATAALAPNAKSKTTTLPHLRGMAIEACIWSVRTRAVPKSTPFITVAGSRSKSGLNFNTHGRQRLRQSKRLQGYLFEVLAGHLLRASNRAAPNVATIFVLMASSMALREHQSIVLGVDQDNLVRELRDLTEKLNVVYVLANWTHALTYTLPTHSSTGADQFLLELNPAAGTGSTTSFQRGESKRAFDEYVNKERELRSVRGVQIVLVSVESIDQLRTAYPNYYADTGLFLSALKYAAS